jgi:hypothetical protein
MSVPMPMPTHCTLTLPSTGAYPPPSYPSYPPPPLLQAQPGDFLHRVADAVDMPLISLIERNAAVVGKLPTLGAWLPTGTRLVVCSDTGAHPCGGP